MILKATSPWAKTQSLGRRMRVYSAKDCAILNWLVVRDSYLLESAEFWKDSPEHERGEVSAETIGTEVFFLRAAGGYRKKTAASPKPSVLSNGIMPLSNRPAIAAANSISPIIWAVALKSSMPIRPILKIAPSRISTGIILSKVASRSLPPRQ